MSESARAPRGGRYVRGALLAIAALFAARIAIGTVAGWAIHPVTVMALFAGLAGGAAAVVVSSVVAIGPPAWDRLWMTVVDDGSAQGTTASGTATADRAPAADETAAPDGSTDAEEFTAMGDWRRTRLQLLFFAVAGGIYPWMFASIFDVPGGTWAALPSSIGTGVLWAGFTLALAASIYLATGTLAASVDDVRDWVATVAGHLAFGVVFGAVVGLWLTAFVV